MAQRFLYKSYFVFCILMRPAISFLKSKNFQLFVKKKINLLYPDRGIVPRSGYIPRSVPFSSLPKWGLWKNEDVAQPRCRTNVNIGPKEWCWHNKIKHSPLCLRVQLHVHIHQSRITLSESVLNDLIPRHFLSHCVCCSIPRSRHMHFGNQHGCKPCTRPKVTLADGSAASAE